MKILITGGAGFIGSTLTRRLAGDGHQVTVYDVLAPQIHGADAHFPEDLASMARCVRGDVCDADALADALQGQEAVVHLAAETGTGQSMYEVRRYDRANNHGTAVLLEHIVKRRDPNLRKLVVASSRAVYGEGRYRCIEHGDVYPHARDPQDLAQGHYEPRCPVCATFVDMLPTHEDARLHPSSFYGLTKQQQEAGVLMFAAQLGLPAYALRYQNVYGPGQSLLNPYTGILAIFSGLARTHAPINIFEDGQGSRDFVHVDDVINATCACLADERPGAMALNVGSGHATTVLEVARAVVAYFGSDSAIKITGDVRLGDIRHNVADLSRVSDRLGYAPRVGFSEGINGFLDWAARQSAGQSSAFAASMDELERNGMLRPGQAR